MFQQPLGPSGVTLGGTSGTMTIVAYLKGKSYTGTSDAVFDTAGNITLFSRVASLLSGGDHYTRSGPQYQILSTSQFSSVRTARATGNGVTTLPQFNPTS
jgi:glucan 1,3-beta-glucosidase